MGLCDVAQQMISAPYNGKAPAASLENSAWSQIRKSVIVLDVSKPQAQNRLESIPMSPYK